MTASALLLDGMMHHDDPDVREFAARVLDLVPEAKPQFTLADLAKAPGAHAVYNGHNAMGSLRTIHAENAMASPLALYLHAAGKRE